MKQKMLLILLIITIGALLTGCRKVNNNKNDWIIDVTDNKQSLNKEEQKIFERAKENYSDELDYVALLAKQVVAGTNYMFLCKDENSYKIVIIYNNLENISQITKVTAFDPTKYVNENYELNSGSLAGGWFTEIPEESMNLPKDIKTHFDKVTETFTGGTYYPIAVLAHQEKNGTNYAVLCYGEGSFKESDAGIYMLTLYVDETEKPEIVSIAAIDLKEFNK